MIFYCDPVNGDTRKGDGSREKPWGALHTVVSAGYMQPTSTKSLVHAGDTIVLCDGEHGPLSLYNYQFESPLLIKSEHRRMASISNVSLSSCKNISLDGIHVHTPVVTPNLQQTLLLSGDSFVVNDCFIQIKENFLDWTLDVWNSNPRFGIHCNLATNVVITNNFIRGYKYPAALNGERITFQYNHLDYFGIDGMNLTANYSVIANNLITNHFVLTDTALHFDGIQMFPHFKDVTKTLRGVRVYGNTVRASTGEYPTINKIPSGVGNDYTQGIVMFDGQCVDMYVGYNVIEIANYHGIALYGVTNSIVEYNTVVPLVKDPNLASWITCVPPTGATTKDVIVRNNIANKYMISSNAKSIVFENNVSLEKSPAPYDTLPLYNPQDIFVSYDRTKGDYDLRLKATSPVSGVGALPQVENPTPEPVVKQFVEFTELNDLIDWSNKEPRNIDRYVAVLKN